MMDLAPLDIPAAEGTHIPPTLTLVESAFAAKPPRPSSTPRAAQLSHPGQAVMAQQVQYQQFHAYQQQQQQFQRQQGLLGEHLQQQIHQAQPVPAITQSYATPAQPYPAMSPHAGYGTPVMVPMPPHMLHRRPVRVAPSSVSSPVARACVAPPSPITRAIALEDSPAIAQPAVCQAAVLQTTADSSFAPLTLERISAVLAARGIK